MAVVAAAAEGVDPGIHIHWFRSCNGVVAALPVQERLPKD